MGNYIVQADLKDKLADNQLMQLTDDSHSGQIVTETVVQAIADAEAEIDGYVAAQYGVPILAPIPRLLKALAIDITVYKLYARRQRVPDDVKDMYREAMRKLEQIARGILLLGPGIPDPLILNAGEIFGPERLFTRETMKGF